MISMIKSINKKELDSIIKNIDLSNKTIVVIKNKEKVA